MELISSLDAEVSSSDAACSEDPCASDWLEEETCEAALATCSAPSASSVTACRRLPLIWRITKKTAAPAAIQRPIRTKAIQRARDEVSSLSSAGGRQKPFGLFR